ncbi:hypothetical protein NQ176_g1750 [Zarea fungicola]|uniref:Uncharacterized protein n=1 Tax=Zarea fungicola TaxID=93591 RepID=A0ACC1NRF4_9HYPO|nr:hypothetical protein NQ176_g1750 [Lecanicillium fungicola]
MKLTSGIGSALLLCADSVLADNPVSGSSFRDNNGLAAAQAASPHVGHQTNGVDNDNCNIDKLSHGCPQQPAWQGTNTFYGNVPGEPFETIPTYWAVAQCGDTWRIIYYVYFKKDTGHKSDWEGIVVQFKDNGDDTWTRDVVIMEQDGNHAHINWSDLNDTFDGLDDWENFQQANLDHGKFYFGKWHHPVHPDWHTTSFKNTCPPISDDDFRNADYQFWSYNNLRPVSVLDPDWQWGRATSPANIDICSY